MRDRSVRKIAYLGLFAALAIIFGYIDSLIPMPFAGMKLGIANLVTIVILYIWSWREASLISLVRILVCGFLFGSMQSILYSLAGAVLSMLVMILIKKIPGFSITGVSIAGGVSHNIGQILVAMAVVENFGLLFYLPILLVAGAITGCVIGIVGGLVQVRVEKIIKR